MLLTALARYFETLTRGGTTRGKEGTRGYTNKTRRIVNWSF